MLNKDINLDQAISLIKENFFDYELLENLFTDLLLKKLRKHEISKSLELWVPDSNKYIGLISLIDSIKSSGLDKFIIKIPKNYVKNYSLNTLKKEISYINSLSEEFSEEYLILKLNINLDYTKLNEVQNDEEIEIEVESQNIKKFEIPNIDFTFKLKKLSKKNLNDFIDFEQQFKKTFNDRSAELKFINNQSSEFNYFSEIENAKYSLLIDNNGIIKNASYTNFINLSHQSLLDFFSENIINTPVQEAYEHGTLTTLNNLIKDNFLENNKGITLPNNMGSIFLLPRYLMHQIYESYLLNNKGIININFYYERPSKNWNSLNSEKRLELVLKIIKATMQSSNLKQDDLILHNISKNRNGDYTRCTVIFSNDIPYSIKPSLLRKLEINLKKHLDKQLEIFAAPAKDTSPLRRLS